jgi:hypothetical protein
MNEESHPARWLSSNNSTGANLSRLDGQRVVALRQIGEQIPGRIARVRWVYLEDRDERQFVVYELTDSLRGPRQKKAA